jgi:hypothetical protein
LNPYALRRKHLKLVRLPISPPPHRGNLRSIPKVRERGKDGCQRVGTMVVKLHDFRRKLKPFAGIVLSLLKMHPGSFQQERQHWL